MLVQSVDRRVISLALVSSILIFLLFNQYRVNQGLELLDQTEEHNGQSPTPSEQVTKPKEEKPSWTFNTTAHERDYGLTDEQCEIAFPGLWENIDNVFNHRSRIGPITEEDVDKSYNTDQNGAEMVRVLLYDRQLYIIEDIFSYHKNRAASILSTINRAIVAYRGELPNIEFVLNLKDGPSGDNQWALTREEGVDKTTWVISDHGWWSWPVPLLGEYSAIRKQIGKQEPAWEDKKPMAAWRGVENLSPIREALLEASKDQPWSDIRGMTWAGNGGSGGAENKDDALTALDHCKYQFLVYTEGATYSGRFKYLHSCNSVIITHKLKWAEFHAPLMKYDGPDQNIVRVERDWSDLDTTMKYLLKNPAIAQRIAENSAKTFRDRYLTPAAQACYTRKMIKAWADLQGFEPKLWEYKKDINDHEVWSIRGKSFETWLVEPMV